MSPSDDSHAVKRLAIVGRGRLGSALATALRASPAARVSSVAMGVSSVAIEVIGPLGRGARADGCDAVLLCVPDAEIAAAAAVVAPGPMVGHCSGANGLEPLAPHEAFSMHPLMTVTAAGADFHGAVAAIDGGTPRAYEFAGLLAGKLGMEAIQITARDRPAYHAAASVASNFLITLEAAAERLGASVGLERHALAPLVRATVENWVELGSARALTGPVARGDEETVARQRQAVTERTPELLGLFDALTAATRELAHAAALDEPGTIARAATGRSAQDRVLTRPTQLEHA